MRGWPIVFRGPALLVYTTLALAARAHPIIYDDWSITASSNRLQARYITNLREVAAAQGIDTNRIGREPLASWVNAISNHAAYLAGHLAVETGGAKRPWQIVDFQLGSDLAASTGSADDLEAARAIIEMTADLPGGVPAGAVLSQSVLQEYNYSPGIPWSVLVRTVVRAADGSELGEAVLTRDHPWNLRLDGKGRRAPGAGAAGEAFEFIRAGLFHVWEGWDHLLFLLGLVLAVRSWRELSALILVFTAAHSLTITLSALGLVRVPPAVVEPGISASIVAVAFLNWLSLRRPWRGNRLAAAGGFGLLHGLGFASGLMSSSAGYHGARLGIAVAGFCVGVELAHAAVGLPAYGLLRRLAVRGNSEPPRTCVQWGSAIVALGGTLMFVQAVRTYW